MPPLFTSVSMSLVGCKAVTHIFNLDGPVCVERSRSRRAASEQ